LWLAGLLGVFLTSLYSFRVVFIVFFGEATHEAVRRPGGLVRIPLAVLAFFSLVAGFVELPEFLGDFQFFSRFLETALPSPVSFLYGKGTELLAQVDAAALCLLGLYVAYLLYVRYPQLPARIVSGWTASGLHRLWFVGWGFDWVYDKVFVQPFLWAARVNKDDVVDLVFDGIALLNQMAYELLSRTQTGNVRGYAAGIAIGAAVIIAIVVLL
jgi:NADH-quinone oxidoreductase subunit L